MQIELTPEMEAVLQAESSLSGLTPTEITLRALADYTQTRQRSRAIHETPISSPLQSQHNAPEASREAVERIISRGDAPAAPRLNLPAGMSIREWIHLGHKY